ncbi:hypothetical protein K1T71_013398 [Dendrolimus kikuchii]|uniref:Uncharacterized protein n=1 Tax=Dendrolimus kikuchii TaxID=765133 RepID=A0ACC1CI02_9NEOP|nr:hypothetical protein K1T71_013398 [Dendrolimus kikuchii]
METNRKAKRWFTPFLKQTFVTATIGLNIIGHGCAIGYPAVLLPQIAMPDSEIKLGPEETTWVASILGITQLFGSIISPPIMSRYGRKIAHYAVLLPVIVGWLSNVLATGFEALLIGRILKGVSIGMLAPLRSVLIGEYTSPKNRGAFLTTVSLTQSFGIFFVHLIGSFLSWQQTALVCVFFSFLSLIMTMYSPESPSWLAAKGRYDECRVVFKWLRGNDEDEELEEMIEARILFEKEMINHKVGKRTNRVKDAIETVQKKEFYKPITLMMHAYVMVNFSGGTTMSTYATMILILIMGPDANVNFWMIFLDSQRLISNTFAVFVINKFRRRTMMFTIGALSVFSQFAIAAYVYFKNQGIFTYDAIWLPALLINLQFFTLATGQRVVVGPRNRTSRLGNGPSGTMRYGVAASSTRRAGVWLCTVRETGTAPSQLGFLLDVVRNGASGGQ